MGEKVTDRRSVRNGRGGKTMEKESQSPPEGRFAEARRGTRAADLKKVRQFLIVLAMLVLTTVLNVVLEHIVQPSSLVFVYLVPTIAGAIYFGTWAAVLSFTAGFFVFNFGFVEPYYTLHISKPQDIYNVIVFFGIASLITYLITTVRRQYAFLKRRLDRVSVIEEMSRDFLVLMPVEGGALTPDTAESLRSRALSQLGQLALKYVWTMLEAPGVVFFRKEDGGLKLWVRSSVEVEITEQEQAAAAWTYNNGEVSGAGTNTRPEAAFYFVPLKSLEGIVGVLGVAYDSRELFPEQRRLLGTIANMVTIVASGWLKWRPGGESV